MWFSSQHFHPLEIKAKRMNTLIVGVHFHFKWDVTTGYEEKHLVMVIQLCKIAAFHPVSSDMRLSQSFNYKIFLEGRRGQAAHCPIEGSCPGRSLWEQFRQHSQIACGWSQVQAVCPGLNMAVTCFIPRGSCCPWSWVHGWLPRRMRPSGLIQIKSMAHPGRPRKPQDPSQGHCCQPHCSYIVPVTHTHTIGLM